jgi:methyltransferase (TIGR00027 family)
MKKDNPSQTALKVALNIIALSHLESMKKVLPEGIVKATSDLLKAAGATTQKRIKKHQSPKIVSLYKKFDWILPGQFESFGYRKAFFEKNVRNSVKNGAEQVLILGAGYDTIGYRLSAEFTNVKFFEIEEPATAMVKTAGLKKLAAAANLFVLPEDLGKKKLSEVLEENSNYDKNKKTIITAEGLLQYLSPESVSDLFNECNKISGADSVIAFTYIGKRPDGKPDAGPRSGLMLWLLKVGGEPWLWSTTDDDLKKLLNDTGWENSPDLTNTENKKGIEYFALAVKQPKNNLSEG